MAVDYGLIIFLVIVVLVGVGGFLYYAYKKD